MNFLKKWPLLLVSFFLITSTAFAHNTAGFLIEPYLGYGFQIAGKEDPNFGDAATKYHGFDLGARVGFRLSNFMIGIDGDYMGGKADYDPGGRADLQKYNFGAYAGLKFGKWSFRGTWYWQANYQLKENDALPIDSQGDGWGVGVGWKFMKYIAINVDYRMFNFDGFKPGELVFAVSLPFDLGEMMYSDEHAHDNDSWWK